MSTSLHLLNIVEDNLIGLPPTVQDELKNTVRSILTQLDDTDTALEATNYAQLDNQPYAVILFCELLRLMYTHTPFYLESLNARITYTHDTYIANHDKISMYRVFTSILDYVLSANATTNTEVAMRVYRATICGI